MKKISIFEIVVIHTFSEKYYVELWEILSLWEVDLGYLTNASLKRFLIFFLSVTAKIFIHCFFIDNTR